MIVAITQRQAGLAVIGLQTVMCFVVGVIATIISPNQVMALGASVGLVIYGALLWTYWKDFKWASAATIIFTTILTGIIITNDPSANVQVSPAFFVPPIIALILAGPYLVMFSGLGILAIVIALIPDSNPYVPTVRFLIILVALFGMIVARIVLDTMRLKAEDLAEKAIKSQEIAEANAQESERRAEQLSRQNEEQQLLLGLVAELETPAIGLAEGVLLAPIVGTIDTARTQRLTSRLLNSIAEQRARMLIIDLAGVSFVDTQVAQSLLKLANAVRLLGCQVVLTGISSKVAMTLTSLGVNLTEIGVAQSPQDALNRYNAEAEAR